MVDTLVVVTVGVVVVGAGVVVGTVVVSFSLQAVGDTFGPQLPDLGS